MHNPMHNIDRRSAIATMTALAGAAALAPGLLAQTAPAAAPASAPFTVPPLPYAYDALEPYIDAQTMQIHHDKHHQTYVNNLNAAVAGHPELAGKSVNDLVANLAALPDSIRTAIQNNGGGHANHSLFWLTLGKGTTAPSGELAKAIDGKFSGLSGFQEKLTAAALSVFGSGWAWLVKLPDGSLNIETTHNQDSPLTQGHTPILALDVWEHAYYLKYQNVRASYVKAYFSVINWDFASSQFAKKA
jgi:Fe-Mn family superoxide dismutase